ncbi:39S ribosomal protein L16, mitochondrial [Microbotryomycetes sp. JL221]|nr:39S ribosomal protein L16, mitochondrial [Microbotryomycetes sp. JL221]
MSLLRSASTLVGSFSRLTIVSSSSSSSSTLASSLMASTSRLSNHYQQQLFQPTSQQVRHKSLQPRRTKYRKAMKGRTPIAIGGSTKGTTLECGDYGLRVNEACRLSAKHLETAEAALKRALKPIRGSKVYLRVFPDIPVCIKGNETRMGKGKGSFEFWACRAKAGRVVFEIGGPNLRPEIAHSVMRLAAAKLPVTTEVIDKTSGPRLGTVELTSEVKTPRIISKGEMEAMRMAPVVATSVVDA